MTASPPAAAPRPFAKTARDENFPVGSRLLPAPLRPHVAAFYAFARAADDVADDPALTAEQKLARLDGMAAALAGTGGTGFPAAARMRQSLRETGLDDRHCRALLAAFRHDATVNRTASWAALLDYCRLSAAPVGRHLLALHGESPALWPPADALCAALQILNHLQDVGDDHRRLDRVYLPADWLSDEGCGHAELGRPAANPALRRVLDRTLDGADDLLEAARPLPGRLRSRRLAAETETILELARRLTRRLRAGDPLAHRIAPGRRDVLVAATLGVARAAWRRP